MVSQIISRIVILVFGTLYPAYASYKAVKTKNVKEYVKWMMYWIVFAFFTCIETFADIFISWVPFYYELKIIFVLWLLSPATKGASILYRKFIHPQLSKREKVIDEYLQQATDQGYSALVTLGSRGVSYATNVVVNTAMKGQSSLADHLRRSYSMNDVSQGDVVPPANNQEGEDMDDELDNRMIEESYQREMAAEMSDDTEGPRMRKHRSNTGDSDLYDVQEKEELEGREKKVGSKKSYTHKERTVRTVKKTH